MLVADIFADIFDGMGEYQVVIPNEESFYVRRKVTMEAAYEIRGLDYEVTGDRLGTNNTIYNINGNEIGTIKSQPIVGDNKQYNTMGVTINPEIETNIYLLLISLCVLLENEHMWKRRTR